MKLFRWVIVATLLVTVTGAPAVLAGAKLKINDDTELDLGIRIQALGLSSDRDIDGDGIQDTREDWIVRRARLRLGAKIGKHVSAFLQTERGVDPIGVGYDMRIIDAFVNIKYNNWTQFIMGLNMSPASRQNLTSSGALMAVDRPGLAYKTLTWGTRALTRFATATAPGTDTGLAALLAVPVRDTGLTVFGSGDFGETAHLKYYFGAYDGLQASGYDNNRYTGRVQFNFWDAEPGYFNLSTYLGKKKTLGIALSYDTQANITLDTTSNNVTDYQHTTLDAFLELPFGETSALTAEAAYQQLDLDDDPTVLRSQGDGYYIQAGWYINKWQPWIVYETWTSDAPTVTTGTGLTSKQGDFTTYRLGISYFLAGHNANIKLGYETSDFDAPVSASGEDSISSIVLGFYITY